MLLSKILVVTENVKPPNQTQRHSTVLFDLKSIPILCCTMGVHVRTREHWGTHCTITVPPKTLCHHNELQHEVKSKFARLLLLNMSEWLLLVVTLRNNYLCQYAMLNTEIKQKVPVSPSLLNVFSHHGDKKDNRFSNFVMFAQLQMIHQKVRY